MTNIINNNLRSVININCVLLLLIVMLYSVQCARPSKLGDNQHHNYYHKNNNHKHNSNKHHNDKNIIKNDNNKKKANPYYNGINFSLRGNSLRLELFKLISQKKSVTYAGIWSFYNSHWIGVGGCSANKLKDVYSDTCWTPGTDQCTSSQNGCYNREHTWCKSYWGGGTSTATPYTDLFHVFPSDGYANLKRSNNPLGYVNSPTYTSPNGGKLGPCAPPTKYSGTCFEVADEYKGNFARAYFYISTAYMGQLDCCNIDGVDGSEILPWLSEVLIQWHLSDPVDSHEEALNEAIYNTYQNNRNPFIDYPNLVEHIFDGASNVTLH